MFNSSDDNNKKGIQFERQFFGVDKTFRELHGKKRPTFLPYLPSILEVKDNQSKIGFDPRNPSGSMAQFLFEIVQEHLLEWGSLLRFFCALGSSLDYYHGVDGFFELHGTIITVDVTSRGIKETKKADFLLSEADIDHGLLEEIAEKIAKKIMKRRSNVIEAKHKAFGSERR